MESRDFPTFIIGRMSEKTTGTAEKYIYKAGTSRKIVAFCEFDKKTLTTRFGVGE